MEGLSFSSHVGADPPAWGRAGASPADKLGMDVLNKNVSGKSAHVGSEECFIFFFITLGLELSDTEVYEP